MNGYRVGDPKHDGGGDDDVVLDHGDGSYDSLDGHVKVKDVKEFCKDPEKRNLLMAFMQQMKEQGGNVNDSRVPMAAFGGRGSSGSGGSVMPDVPSVPTFAVGTPRGQKVTGTEAYGTASGNAAPKKKGKKDMEIDGATVS